MATKQPAPKTEAEHKKYILKKAHTHQGVPLQIGDKVPLTHRQAVWLKTEGVI